jgi:predicted kinase
MAPHRRRLDTLRAVLSQRLARFGQAIWQALEAHGRRRSDRELRALAERWRVTNPKLARELKSYLNGGSSY